MNEKVQYDITRGAAKVSALSSGKIDRYEFLRDEKKYSHLIKVE